jgi:acetolactate synthase-1/2/3 large subunit
MKLRGADIVARTLDKADLTTVFTLSGNHIMPLFDGAIGTRLELVHVRHEAAAVHMADAVGRLTGRCGIALVSGGAGHANAVAALATALPADSPLVLLSGHAGPGELGRGAFQEIGQADMAAPVAKAAWVARSAATLGTELAEAVRIALSGRPGPVHLSLPFDLLEERVEESPELWPKPSAFTPHAQPLTDAAADAVLELLGAAKRPLVLVGPQLCHSGGLSQLRRLEAAAGVPVVPMESPRGLNDARLGAFAEVLPRADLIVLLGKALDFSLRFGDAPFVDAGCRFVAIDADEAMVDRVARGKGARLVFSAVPAGRGRPHSGPPPPVGSPARRRGRARCARPSPGARRPGRRWPRASRASCTRSRCAARWRRSWRAMSARSWCAMAASSRSGRRCCSTPPAVSSTGRPARSAPRSRSPSPPVPPTARPR